MSKCTACPRACNTDRDAHRGYCGQTDAFRIARAALHMWEEPCISGSCGSGTVFFSGCNLGCVFCQNYRVSHRGQGIEISADELIARMLDLQAKGAHNINLVTPTHFAKQLVPVLAKVKTELHIPIVYNTGGYEKISTLQMIDPFVDIYLPDMKFYSPELSLRYLGREDYFNYAEKAVAFMSNKPLVFDENGKMLSGFIVRHLVMPLCANDSKKIVKWFSQSVGEKGYLSLMRQYTPFGEIKNYPELARKITSREYTSVVETALDLGIEKLFIQEKSSAETSYIPAWDF